jgi:hypothetical protein
VPSGSSRSYTKRNKVKKLKGEILRIHRTLTAFCKPTRTPIVRRSFAGYREFLESRDGFWDLMEVGMKRKVLLARSGCGHSDGDV